MLKKGFLCFYQPVTLIRKEPGFHGTFTGTFRIFPKQLICVTESLLLDFSIHHDFHPAAFSLFSLSVTSFYRKGFFFFSTLLLKSVCFIFHGKAEDFV